MSRRTYVQRTSLKILLTQIEHLSGRLNSFEKKELALQLSELRGKFYHPLDKEDALKRIIRDFFGKEPVTGFPFSQVVNQDLGEMFTR